MGRRKRQASKRARGRTGWGEVVPVPDEWDAGADVIELVPPDLLSLLHAGPGSGEGAGEDLAGHEDGPDGRS